MPDTAVQWTDTITVNTNTANTQRGSRIIQLDNGDIIVAWETDDPAGVGYRPGFDIIAQRYDQGGNRIGGEFNINQGWFADDEMDFSLASIPGGGFIVAFEDDDGITDIRMEIYDAAGTRIHAPSVAHDTDPAFDNFRNPEVAVSSATSAMIVYEEVNANGSDVQARIYNPTTNALGVEFTGIGGLSVTDASVTALTNGNYVLVTTVDNGDESIYYRLFDDTGAGLSGALVVDNTTIDGFEDSGARVEALSGGGFVIAWEDVDANDRDIAFQLYNANGTLNGPRRFFPEVDNGLDENYTELRITALSDGGFAILADNQTEFDLRLQRFDSSGLKVGNLIEIDDVNETNIDITLLADGRMAMAYNNGSDIKMRIFDARDAATVGVGNIGIGTAGNDTIAELGTGFGDGIFAGAGNDTVIISNGANNNETFDGGTGIDTLAVDESSDATTIDLLTGQRFRNAFTDVIDTIINFENATGAAEDDVISGDENDNILSGLGGNDILWGREGADTLVGGTGDDTYLIDDFGDTIIEGIGEGVDAVYTHLDYTLAANIEIGLNTATGTAGNLLIGNDLDNTLILSNTMASTGTNGAVGGAGNDTIYVQSHAVVTGGTGNDSIVLSADNNTALGGAGDDVYIVIGNGNVVTENAAEGNDTVYSYAADFTLGSEVEILALITFDAMFAQNGTGNASANTIIGSGSNNVLAGLDGSDFLIGGGGDDILIGGTGLDVLQGNVGNDSFFYNNFGELGDIIQDWVNTDDSFYFFGLAFGIGAGTSLIDGVNFVSSTTPSSVAAQATFLWDSDDYDLYYDGDGTGDGVSAVLVASLQDSTTVDVTDFVFF